MNDPITAWVLQVYLRDRGIWLWLGPSHEIYGGFAARIERYRVFSGYFLTAHADAQHVQDAARQAAEQLEGFSWDDFSAWRAEWEKGALVED